MIEVWEQKGRKPIIISPEELEAHIVEDLLVQEQASPEEKKATHGIASFLTKLHNIEGVDGVALSLITKRPYPTTLNVGVKAPCYDSKKEDNARMFRAVSLADAELAREIQPFWPSAGGFYSSIVLDSRRFVSILRRRCGRSKTEELMGVFLFKK